MFKFFSPTFECFAKYEAFCSHIFDYACLRRKAYCNRRGSRLWKNCICNDHPSSRAIIFVFMLLCYRVTFILRSANVSFYLSFLIPFLMIKANQLRFFVVYCTSYNLIAVGQSRDCVYFAM